MTRFFCSLIIDDKVIETWQSEKPMRPTLFLVAKELRGIPQAELVVRSAYPKQIGWRPTVWLHTNFRGEIDEIELYSPCSPLVTPLNPYPFNNAV